MKLELKRLRAHNREVAKGGVGLEESKDVRETVEEKLGAFSKQVMETRLGKRQDEKGNQIPAYDLSLEEAVRGYFGFKDVAAFFKSLDIRTGSFSIHQVAKRFGLDHVSTSKMEGLLLDHSSFANPMTTADVASDFRFILPEIFLNAIRTGYQHTSLHKNWIRNTINLTQEQAVMPLILRGDGMPSKVNEGANIPMGSIKFGKKTVSVFKIGTGFSITDELLMASSLDLLFIFLEEVGNDMAIGADAQAFTVLMNGEQADGSESSPEIGTENGTSFQYKDLKRVFTRFTRLGTPADRIIAGEDDGIDLTSIDRFEGFQGQSRLANIKSIIGVPDSFNIDTWLLPANKILYVAPSRAMVKLQYRGMLTERRRNPQNQTEEMFVSDWINFAIVKRDARLLQNKSLLYSGNGFPAYMDVDSRINATYQNL